MVRVVLACLCIAADGKRVSVHHSGNVDHHLNVSLSRSVQHPVPTPDGYTFNFGMLGGCYAQGSSSVGTATADSPPAGYKVNKGQKCPGKWIEKWSTGDFSGYGEGIKDIVTCAKKCNEHEECAGFYTDKGICSYYRSGELQDTAGAEKEGFDCFVKWEVRDLSAQAAPPPDFSGFVPGSVQPPTSGQVSDCLCLWDIDRTLTAKQGWQDDCPGTQHYPDIKDYAYNGGSLILSELAQNIKTTFCGQCYFGVVSAGTASGPDSPNRDIIDDLVDAKFNVGDWVDGCPIPTWGTKVLCCDEGHFKKQAVTDIVTWLDAHGVKIADEKVHFFDDKDNNIEAMGMGGPPFYNAHQVSCGSRDGSRGGCGGMISEVLNKSGQHFCDGRDFTPQGGSIHNGPTLLVAILGCVLGLSSL